MTLEAILTSAIGQLLAIGIVIVGWTIWHLWLFLKTFAQAASQTRIEITCKKK